MHIFTGSSIYSVLLILNLRNTTNTVPDLEVMKLSVYKAAVVRQTLQLTDWLL